MPRLSCTFREFIGIIEHHGFVLHRQGKGSHSIYRGMVGGAPRLVTVAGHNPNETIKPGTLAAMIRQSGLSRSLFTK